MRFVKVQSLFVVRIYKVSEVHLICKVYAAMSAACELWHQVRLDSADLYHGHSLLLSSLIGQVKSPLYPDRHII